MGQWDGTVGTGEPHRPREMRRLLGLTLLGAVLPGAGLVAAGRRAAGGTILAAFLAVVGGVAAVVATGSLTKLLVEAAVRPRALTALELAAPLFAGLWCLVIAASHVALRGWPLNRFQQALATSVVLALCVPVAWLGVQGARYASAQHGLLEAVFPATGGQSSALGGPTASPGGSSRPGTTAGGPAANQHVRVSGPPLDNPVDALAPRVNVLLLGSDAGPDRWGTRTDTVIVASIDTTTGNTVLLSLPRNLENVPFPTGSPFHRLYPHGFDCGDTCLLNAVWELVGVTHSNLLPGVGDPGLVATRQAVEATLGLRVDYSVVVNMRAFLDVIDALGGVTVDVPHTLVVGDPAHPDLVLHPGRQHLDAWQALWYVRVRQGYSDYDRMLRQRCLLGALVNQASPMNLLLRLPAIDHAVGSTVTTDIPQGDLPAFVDLARRMRGARMSSLAFTDEVIDPGHPDFAEIRRLAHLAIAASERPHPRSGGPAGSGHSGGTGQSLRAVC
ncbi:MAG TPA: LCP family protein [Nocardioidaceae bacterium]|nr:LCP family protein [Nocardioidaceae bacterium]